jgi:hypothetical protein
MLNFARDAHIEADRNQTGLFWPICGTSRADPPLKKLVLPWLVAARVSNLGSGISLPRRW